jgi:hypothetical protein
MTQTAGVRGQCAGENGCKKEEVTAGWTQLCHEELEVCVLNHLKPKLV